MSDNGLQYAAHEYLIYVKRARLAHLKRNLSLLRIESNEKPEHLVKQILRMSMDPYSTLFVGSSCNIVGSSCSSAKMWLLGISCLVRLQC